MRLPFLRKAASSDEPLVVSMSGARLGDTVVFAGQSASLALPLAARTGLSGRCLVVGSPDALWLGWIPGTSMVAAGIAMTPDAGGDEAGWSLIFFGGLTLIPGWPLYFFPLIAAGAYIRSRRGRLTPESSVLPL